MTIIADYQILSDTSFTIQSGKKETLTFNYPDGLTTTSSRQNPILCMRVLPRGDVNLNIRLNDRQIIEWDPGMDRWINLWEPFSFKTAFPDGADAPKSTKLEISCHRGESVLINNVVMWYQREIDQ